MSLQFRVSGVLGLGFGLDTTYDPTPRPDKRTLSKGPTGLGLRL